MPSLPQVVTLGVDLGANNMDDDGACMEKCSITKRKREECPESPTPSLDSETSAMATLPHTKRRKQTFRRRVSFQVDENDNLTNRFNIFEKYDGKVKEDVWWSKGDLRKIMKREGRLVLNLKIDASKRGDASCMANALKQSINETFKKCVDAPLVLSEETPAIFEFIPDEESVAATTTTRGLERYIAPIMSAHRQMVVKSFLISQGQLSDSDPNFRTEVLGSRYEHLSKIAANFAVVMAQCDAKLATASL